MRRALVAAVIPLAFVASTLGVAGSFTGGHVESRLLLPLRRRPA